MPLDMQPQNEIMRTRKDGKFHDWRDYNPHKYGGADPYAHCEMLDPEDYTPHLDTKDWQAMSAECKMENIWRLCLIDERRERFYTGWEFETFFAHDMNLSYDHVADTMPLGRIKKTHPVGTIAKMEWIPHPDQPYTGMFTGSKNVLMRISETVKTTPEVTKTVPGFGLKLLRDGMYSANVLAMFSFDG